jgi:5-methylcytosine-specific restriction endonuclease McrA
MRVRVYITQTCGYCQLPFQVEPSRLNHKRGKFCSPACQYAGIKERNRVTLICPVCSNSFIVEKKAFNERTPTYCSRQCAPRSESWKRNLGESLRVSEKAQEQRVRSVIAMNQSRTREERSQDAIDSWKDPESRERRMKSIKLRSESEEWKSARHFQKGAAHPKYTGGRRERNIEMARYPYKQWRLNVFRRDDFTCQRCFSRKSGLVAHHIKHWAEYPELRYEVSNGVTLCDKCHNDLHHPS